jgi:hypothetical protein
MPTGWITYVLANQRGELEQEEKKGIQTKREEDATATVVGREPQQTM